MTEDEQKAAFDERFERVYDIVRNGLEGFTTSLKKCVEPGDQPLFLSLYLGELLGCLCAASNNPQWEKECIQTVTELAQNIAKNIRMGMTYNPLTGTAEEKESKENVY